MKETAIAETSFAHPEFQIAAAPAFRGVGAFGEELVTYCGGGIVIGLRDPLVHPARAAH